MAKHTKIDLSDTTGMRKQAGENQAKFWSRFGVTQSGGSRYEQGRSIPNPTRILLALYAAGKVTDADLAQARTVANV